MKRQTSPASSVSRPIGLHLSSWILLGMAIMLCLGIFYFSSRNGEQSSFQSRGLIDFLSLPQNGTFSFLIRKSAHFLLYASLGIFCFLFFSSMGFSGWKAFGLALLVCIVYASGDELHQHFVAGREGKIQDVFLDTAGACAGVLVSWLFLSVFRFVRRCFKTI